MGSRVIDIAGRKVGEGHPPIISAELGLNHGGDINLAHDMIWLAAEAGCDAVKVQNYRTADFVKSKNEIYTDGRGRQWNMWELCQRCELSYKDLEYLKYQADDANVIFHSTPTSREGVDDLVKLGVKVIKNGADYWENNELIRYMHLTMLPVILSTAEGFGQLSGKFYLEGTMWANTIVLHTVREYPAKDWNRTRFLEAQKYYPLVGYSDHTIGIEAAVEAVKLGAVWVEFHMTLDQSMHGPDHHFSKTPDMVNEMVRQIRGIR